MRDRQKGTWLLTRRDFVRDVVSGLGSGALLPPAGVACSGAAFAAPPGVPSQGVTPLGPGPARIALLVNAQPHEVTVDPRVTLLDALRERIGLTGTKKGCDRGECGACTVHVNGRRILACMTLAVMHTGDRITTIEGIADGDRLHPVQTAFIDHDAFQCGYCTSGQIMSAVALLDEARNGEPSAATTDIASSGDPLSEPEVRERMSGNLCRCSCYPQIVAAVRQAGDAAAVRSGGR